MNIGADGLIDCGAGELKKAVIHLSSASPLLDEPDKLLELADSLRVPAPVSGDDNIVIRRFLGCHFLLDAGRSRYCRARRR
jgi:hypothetical protein